MAGFGPRTAQHSASRMLGWLILVLGAHHNWRQLAKPSACETTYIYEGYGPAELPPEVALAFPRYKLITWADRDPAQRKGEDHC